jgi:hypothetical protein
MSTLSKTLSSYFSDPQLNDLKRVALASLGLGAGIPLAREMFGREAPMTLPSASGIGVSVPVPEDDMSALPNYTSRSSKKQTKSVKDLKNYNPYSKLKEKRAFDWGDLANPAYMPGLVAAIGAPAVASHYLTSKIIDYKNKAESNDEMDQSKEDFAKALLEANSNRLNREVVAHNPSAQAASDLYGTAKHLSGKALDNSKKLLDKSKKLFNRPVNVEDMAAIKAGSDIFFNSEFSADLEKLANKELPWYDQGWNAVSEAFKGGLFDLSGRKGSYWEQKTAPGNGAPNETPSIPMQLAKDIFSAGTEAAKGVGKEIYNQALLPAFNTVLPALKGYGGVLGAAGLLGGAAGTWYGHRAAQRDDKETADSYKYLSEFLRRQQEQGAPVYATPVPVAKAKKPWYSLS